MRAVGHDPIDIDRVGRQGRAARVMRPELMVAFKRNLAWTSLGQASYFLIQFTGSVILARLLTPYEMGVYALALAIVGILNVVQSVSLGAYLVREAELTPQKIAASFTVNLAISVLLALVIAILAFAGDLVTSDGGVKRVLLILAVSPLVNIFGIIPWSMLEREADFRTQSIINIVRSILSTIATVGLAWLGYSYYSIAWGQLTGIIVSTVMLNVIARRHATVRLSIAGWKEIGRFGSQMIAISGVNTVASRATDLLLGKILGIVALGLYSRASGIFNLFWENLHLVFARVVFAEFARQKRDGKSLRGTYLAICEIVSAALWPVFTGLAVLAEPLIRLVYGAKWVAAAGPFQFLALAGVVEITITMTWEIFVVSNATAKQARLEVVRTLVATALFGVGCLISLSGAAAARVAAALFYMLLYRPHVERMTDTTLEDMMPIYARSGLLTLLAVAPAASLMHLRGASASYLTFWEISASVAAGVMLWGVGLVGMRHPIYHHVQALIRRRPVELFGSA